MDNKKQEIAIKAGDMFMRYGIKSVSMDDLARELGVSKKTIYTHFSDKNVLVEFIIGGHLNAVQSQCLNMFENAENAVHELFMVMDNVSNEMNDINPSVMFDLQKYHPSSMEIIVKHENEFILPFILKNIERGRKEGLYREDFNPEIIAQMYVNVQDLIFKRTIKTSNNMQLFEVSLESLRFILFGMSNNKGKEYIRKHLINEK